MVAYVGGRGGTRTVAGGGWRAALWTLPLRSPLVSCALSSLTLLRSGVRARVLTDAGAQQEEGCRISALAPRGVLYGALPGMGGGALPEESRHPFAMPSVCYASRAVAWGGSNNRGVAAVATAAI